MARQKKQKQKQKQRVAFRKNREKRARRGNLTRDVDQARDDETQSAQIEDLPTGERLSGKGELSRNRTVIGESDQDGELRIEVDESTCSRGRVLMATGLNSVVQDEAGRNFECTVRRVVRTLAREARNAVVAGDWVLFRKLDQESGVIERVEPRQSVLSRNSGRQEHVIVSNVDQIVIVVSAAEPALKPGLVDRFLISAEKGETSALICVNKVDLIDPAEIQSVLGMYGQLGYRTVLTSAETGAGLDRLQFLLKDRGSVFTGQSGVGKSSLLNAIQPNLVLDTGTVSAWSQKGRHTTRRAELIALESGGWVVDTPGIRQLSLWDVIPEEVSGFFVEFHPFVADCRFPDCSHTHETDCRIKQAVEAGLITRARYISYLRIMTGQEHAEV